MAAVLAFALCAPLLFSNHQGLVEASIADCRSQKDCMVDEGECCARVIVKDALNNKIDSHYCLQKQIIDTLGNRYYFKGILGQAYCDYDSALHLTAIPALIILFGLSTVAGFL